MTVRAYISLGSNLALPQQQLETAIAAIDKHPGMQLIACSRFYVTKPWGSTVEQPNFVNAVVAIETKLPPLDLLAALQAIEHEQGRERIMKNGPRTIDCDILLYGDALIDLAPTLIVPHPRLKERTFVLAPLFEIAPDLILPGSAPMPLKDYWDQCEHDSIIEIIPRKTLPTSMPVSSATALSKAALQMRQTGLRALFAADPERANRYALQVGDIYCDYSKNLLTPTILDHLIAWAQSAQVSARAAALMQGEKINTSENRPALHTALRRDPTRPLMVDGQDVMPEIAAQRAKMGQIVQKLQQGLWFGATGKAIDTVVHIGIGGSDLGPAMAVEALMSYRRTTLQLHFVSNVDPVAISSVLDQCDPATTLFIISSKSFTTPESLANAQVARSWLQQKLGTNAVEPHWIAVTANPEKAQAFGIDPQHILSFAAWVGGRYSIWSTIGLPLAILIGMEQFEQFLAGARLMDEHFLTAPLSKNMPVLLALLGAWSIHFCDMPTIAILPYAQGLRRLPDYLQQLDMESNGKHVRLDGKSVSYSTGPVVWGQAGTNGQHAFYQLLHQGTHAIAIDFILVAQNQTAYPDLHRQLLANGIAQAQAMMQGRLDSTLSPMEVMEGNKPSNTILLKALTPSALGQLLALYEHKVFVQGVLWELNSFDQPGVELGKLLAKRIEACLKGPAGEDMTDLDTSTNGILRKIADFNNT